MAGEAPEEGRPATLADKVDWLIEQARPAGGSPLSNSDVCRMIYDAIKISSVDGYAAKERAAVSAAAQVMGIDGATVASDFSRRT